MSDGKALAVRDQAALPAELTVADVLAQTVKIQDLMKSALKDGEHYGVIPGTNKDKKTLLKPGAEKLCLMFQFAPEYKHEITQEPFTVISTCTLYHRPSGTIVATGSGMCSAAESKYAWRQGDRACPSCKKEGTIIKGREEYGGGWLCFGKKGGCGAKFPDGTKEIESQNVGRIANPDIADQYNTVLKMADKRSLVAAVLNGTAASDIFTQDLEDLQENLQARSPAPDPAPAPDPKPVQEGTKEPRRRAAAKKTDDSVDTTATVVPEPSAAEKCDKRGYHIFGEDFTKGCQECGFKSGQAQPPPLDNAIPKEMPPVDGKEDGEIISAQHALWLVAEAKATNAMLEGMMKSIAPKKNLPAELTYGEFKLGANILKRRREMQKGASK